MTDGVGSEGRSEVHVAGLEAAHVHELLAGLASASRDLRERPVAEIAASLGRVGDRLADPTGGLHLTAVDGVADEAGYSGAMARRVVSGMARDWTEPRLRTLLEAEFGDARVLDHFVARPGAGSGTGEATPDRWLRAMGDRVAAHICAGSVPGVSVTSLIRSLLVKTPVLVKPGAGDRLLPQLFSEALAEEDPQLATCLQVRYWRGGEREVEDAVLAGVDRLVFYGSDAAARSLRDRAPIHVPMVVYHHRISAVVMGPGKPRDDEIAGVARAASTFEQRGCVSPHRVFVLGEAGSDAARSVAERLAAAMAAEAVVVAPGPVDPGDAARVQQLRGRMELRAAAGAKAGVWSGPGATWTVALEEPDHLDAAVGSRTVQVTWADDLDALAAQLEPLGPHLQTVGVAALGDRADAVYELLARVGATRICPPGEIDFPPAWWLHDGGGPLRDLTRWVERAP